MHCKDETRCVSDLTVNFSWAGYMHALVWDSMDYAHGFGNMDYGIWHADSIRQTPLPGTWESAVHSGPSSRDSGYGETVKVPGTTIACAVPATARTSATGHTLFF